MVKPINNSQAAAAATQKAQPKKPNEGDAIRWAILTMIEAVDVGFHRAETQAKQLRSNGDALHRVIDEERNCKWHSVPKGEKRYQRDTHYHYHMEGHSVVGYTYYTYKALSGPFKNQSKIDAARAANREESKVRQQLQGKMTILQQLGQVSETRVNSTVNGDAQSMQEVSSMIKMVDQLTQMALIKRR